MAGELILRCFHIRTSAHVLHLTTRSYATHKALNEFYDALVGLVDSFAEAYIGTHGMIKVPDVPYEPHDGVPDLLDDADDAIEACRAGLDKADTHLLNILDEMLALVASTRYKLKYLK